MVIARALSLYAERVSYFWDLFGAALGALISLALINRLGALGGVMVCTLLMLFAASFFATQVSKRLTLMCVLLSLGFLLGMFFPLRIKMVRQVDVRMLPWAWGINGLSLKILHKRNDCFAFPNTSTNGKN